MKDRSTRTHRWLVALMCGLAAPAVASALTVPDDVEVGAVEVLADPTGQLDAAQVLALTDGFEPAPEALNYRLTRTAYWVRFRLQLRGEQPRALFLTIENALLDHLTLYVPQADGSVSRVEGGDALPAVQRPFRAPVAVLPFTLEPTGPQWVLLRIQSETSIVIVPMVLRDRAGLETWLRTRHLWHGAVLGLTLALLLFNFFIWLQLRDPVYLWYVAYLPVAYLSGVLLNGFGADTLLPGTVWWSNTGIPVVGGLAFGLNLLFTRAFLETARLPVLDRAVRAGLVGCGLLTALPFVVEPVWAYRLAEPALFVFPLLSMWLGIEAGRAGRSGARFYVIGQAASWLGILAFGGALRGFLPAFDGFTETVSVGIAVDALFLAQALGDRIRGLRLAGEEAERRAQANLAIQKEELERLVAHRTAELDAARAQAEALAMTDALTGLRNRRGFDELAQRELGRTRRLGHPLSTIMLDIDHFKQVNDRVGHAAGDAVLVRLAQVLREETRIHDVVSRWGGEEFLVLLPDTDPAQAFEVAERLRLAVSRGVTVPGETAPATVTISLGIAALSPEHRRIEEVVAEADAALYRAKLGGRNRTATSLPDGL
jgi:diguanylate cyclase (GGDEF)-like protein